MTEQRSLIFEKKLTSDDLVLSSLQTQTIYITIFFGFISINELIKVNKVKYAGWANYIQLIDVVHAIE